MDALGGHQTLSEIRQMGALAAKPFSSKSILLTSFFVARLVANTKPFGICFS